ncbi:chorismate mutase [Lichenihabitans sp. PAMC28606]|uniref:chorismate mutase n=1 Tax=Lichenihabitans sp. PAMC28606 TaxID=2880932 RepID=UPI001D0AB387|nr:chorismate mutase [Lichenihabitans sp. PAMC28606]UDL94263.1 chorismate mutase [Lichenihabitans sp. PAMC28606]
MTEQSPADVLNELRVDIDRIDAAMHNLLIERGGIIERLIAVKFRQGGGSAFRPGREAEMMRRIAERHRGPLPLDTVESIWRVIIATFTFVQAAYSVHADMTAGDAAMRDSARFHFGFTVPLVSHLGATGVIEAVNRANGDLGMIGIDAEASGGAWWARLTEPDAPKIIARLPFVERSDHPAGLPVFVIARSTSVAAVRDVVLHSVSVERWRDGLPAAIGAIGGSIIGNVGDQIGLVLLVATPGALPPDTLADTLRPIVGEARIAEIGSHAARFDFDTQPLPASFIFPS